MLKRIFSRLWFGAVDRRGINRKRRSEALVKAEGIPINEYLPRIEDESESSIRSQREIEDRAKCLCLVAMKAQELTKQEAERFLAEHEIEGALSFEEKKFLYGEIASERERIQFSWSWECYWVMLWALGYVETLGKPDKECDPFKAESILQSLGADGFRQQARLRRTSEILDQADLIYRYHWAVRDAGLRGLPSPAGLNPDVVQERHRALNWIIGYADQSWDDITTDT